jgi:integrase
MKVKEPVRLRQKKLANGNISLYLDIYVDGLRQYEFLKLYLIPEQTREDKTANKQTLSLANAIKSQRIVEIQDGRYGFKVQSSKVDLFSYIEAQAEKKVAAQTRKAWLDTAQLIREYDNREVIPFDTITQDWAEGFCDFLDNAQRSDGRRRFSANSKKMYYSKLAAIFNQAVRDDLLDKSPIKSLRCPYKGEESTREYLTIDELKRLAEVPCTHQRVKEMFLFSCFTGLRWSDVTQITWGDIEETPQGTRIVFHQQKTKGLEYLDISEQAVELMGPRQGDNKEVFGEPLSTAYLGVVLTSWVLAAGINKHITFHSARHTFAVMMLQLDVDLYTVSKLLGHRDIKTTQIYAKILDKKKQEAVNKIPRIL